MIVVFYVVFLFGAWIFWRRRSFDFVSASFFGMGIYFLPGFFGVVMNPYLVGELPIEPIAIQTYLVWILALCGMIAAGLWYNPSGRGAYRPPKTDLSFDLVLIGLLIVSLLGALYVGGDDLLSAEKDDVLAAQGRVFILYSTLSQIAFTSFVLQRKIIGMIVSGLSIAFLVFIGYRVELAVASIAILISIAMYGGVRALVKPRVSLPAFAFVILAFTYKSIGMGIRGGRYDVVQNTLYGGSFVSDAVMKSEPFTTQTILNEVLLRSFSVSSYNIFQSFVAFIPFSNVIFKFNENTLGFSFQDALFPNLDYGLASNIYANFYSAFGWVGVTVFVALHSFGVIQISKSLASEKLNSYAKIVLLLIGSFLAFYIHRNDLAYSITMINRYIYTALMAWLISRIVAAVLAGRPGHGTSSSS